MATHDYSLANQSGAAFRGDLNNALSAIASNNSSSTDPNDVYQWYYDTGDTTLKIRNAANSAAGTIKHRSGDSQLWSALAASPSFKNYVCGQHLDVRHRNA